MARRKLTTNPTQARLWEEMALIRQAGRGELGRGITYLSWTVAIRAFWHLDVRGGCVLVLYICSRLMTPKPFKQGQHAYIRG
jgi:hypothetical protein